jgi:putative transposase
MFDDEFDEQAASLSDPPDSSLTVKALYLSPDLNSFPEKVRQEAINKYELIMFVRQNLNRGWTQFNLEPLIEKYCADHPKLSKPNWRTVVRWNKSLENNDTPTSLVPKHRKKGNLRIKTDSAGEDFFVEALERFLKAERPNVSIAFSFYRDKCLLSASNVKPMSKRSFYNRIDKLSSYDVAVRRLGKRKADMKFGHKGSIIKPERVLQLVEIDHTPLDIILLDDVNATPIGRPYLTLLKDVYSGCLIGYHLTFKSPSYASVVKALSHSILPKVRSKELWGIDWPCHGKMEVLVADNGAELWASSLDQVCLELGINLQYNKVGTPWHKPHIERSFRTINDLFLNDLSGKTFRSIDERGEYNSVKNASIKFHDFVHAFEKWVAEVYNRSTDSRGMNNPLLKWNEGIKKFAPATLTEHDIKELPKVLGLKKTSTLQQSGITFESLRYDSTELADYRKRKLYGDNDRKEMYKIDIDDLSQIYVFLTDTQEYLTVPCTEKNYTENLSLDQHLVNRAFTKTKNKLNGTSDKDLAASREEIREILAGHEDKVKSSTKTSTSKKVAQHKGISSEKVRNSGDADKRPSTHEAKVPDSSDDVSELEALWQSFNKD